MSVRSLDPCAAAEFPATHRSNARTSGHKHEFKESRSLNTGAFFDTYPIADLEIGLNK